MFSFLRNYDESNIWHKFFYPILIVVLFAVLYNYTFDTKIFLGGDNADYYVLAKSLNVGNGYKYMADPANNPANHFPPGYPAILALCMFFSSNIIFLKLVNGAFLLATALVVYFLAKSLLKDVHVAAIASVLVLCNQHMLRYSSIMMSEVPYIFILMTAMFLTLKSYQSSEKQWNKDYAFFTATILGVVAYYVRSIGMVLPIAFIMFWSFKKSYLKAALSFMISLVGILPWVLRGRSLGGASYTNQLFAVNPYRPELGQMENIGQWMSRFSNNVVRYISKEIPAGIINIYNADYEAASSIGGWVLGLALLAVGVFAIWKIKSQYKWFVFLVLAGHFGVLFLWPDVWYGERFILPIIPLMLILVAYAFRQIPSLKWNGLFTLVLALIIVLFNAGSIYKLNLLAKRPTPKHYRNYFEVAKAVKLNTEEDAVIACRKPGLFYLYADRKVFVFSKKTDPEEFLAHLKERGATYVVLDNLGYSSTFRYLLPAVKALPEHFKPVYKKDDPTTILLKVIY